MGAGKPQSLATATRGALQPKLFSRQRFRALWRAPTGMVLRLEHRQGQVEGGRVSAIAQAVRELVFRCGSQHASPAGALETHDCRHAGAARTASLGLAFGGSWF